MSSFRLDGKVILITGATQGIGRACTLELASRGARVIGSARNPEPVAELMVAAKRSGGEFTFIQGDASNWADCKRVAEAARAVYGKIDVLINNAGISRPHAKMEEIEESDWRAVVGSTLEGTVAMTRYVLPGMIAQKDGLILNISSSAAVAGLANLGA
jgi:3-oxoacyl-[acyl-carrier protein] reductase